MSRVAVAGICNGLRRAAIRWWEWTGILLQLALKYLRRNWLRQI